MQQIMLFPNNMSDYVSIEEVSLSKEGTLHFYNQLK